MSFRNHRAHLRAGWPALLVCALALAACGDDTHPRDPRTPEAIRDGESLKPLTPGAGGGSDAALLLPDLRTLEPDELYIEGDAASGTRRVRFSTTLLNAGDGPLELFGTTDANGDRVEASQRIYRDDESVVERVAGRFRFDNPHGHWHFEDFTVFELWSHDDDGDLDELLATTGKGTFCALDERPALAEATTPAYFGCDAGLQGLSAGWTDTYEAALPGQELDISDLDDGTYAIRATVDPENLLVESDDDNNATTSFIEISGDSVTLIDDPSARSDN